MVTVDPPSDVVDEALVDAGDFIEVNPARKVICVLAFQEKVHRGRNDPQLIGASKPNPFEDDRVNVELYFDEIVVRIHGHQKTMLSEILNARFDGRHRSRPVAPAADDDRD
jgi:hypothetical protein